ncbi:nucleotidyl transferase AbiEii/AbiGii toxin family protein [Amycolatopsis rhizosphaerae]|uniref:Nucleotidyl transferase AbiEii/AbiGii toxin family protein n=1 Tax=Amycolatopsis rhizosphaerae TaxID=2053003 RepID=A0A558DMB0_9PSEU|nr:nucleotidyl transferase AbiEii/AbiGii toxin family protein [Amycolatopsis rhizosphaerae]TVT62162.1 nucleotidyl transferase AbiEii/AbiGii toxin family protein [Amycolatopsis rhizosphaerae]
MTIIGDFDIHLTVYGHQSAVLAVFGTEHRLKVTHIVLDRGTHASQPMLTLAGSGTLDDQLALAASWSERLRAAGLGVQRVKVEAAPWNEGVPRTDAEAADEPPVYTGRSYWGGRDRPERYFEHHVKLLLPDDAVDRLVALTDLVVPHGARPSRVARRRRPDGREERFATQRCHGVGRETAMARLDALVADLRAAGHEIVEIEQEYVVHDTALHYDHGWLEPARARHDPLRPAAPAGADRYPATYLPLPTGEDVEQSQVFDPAMKHRSNAYRPGEPRFTDPAMGARWRQARAAARNHVLTLIADSPWAESLVLRGSVTMPAWIGDDAREPGDIDFVVLPPERSLRSPDAARMFDDVLATVLADPAAGLDADGARSEDIWTYERADGRRLVIPFAVDGVPPGAVQLDFVFGEPLPIPPAPLHLPAIDRVVLAATAELSLAWKLLWLDTDMYPQGKDLYDATLLAERTGVPSLSLVRDLLRPQLEDAADAFTAESVLAWDVDWSGFRDAHPHLPADDDHWTRRLALALDAAWR